MTIRKIAQKDNKKIEEIIKSTILEFGLPTSGSAFEDRDTSAMFEAYQDPKADYFVIEEHNEVVGGGGIKRLKGDNDQICELQKLYLVPHARGKGYGKLLFDTCLKTAKDLGYKQCYLESDARMTQAIALYAANGFEHVKQPLGDTGHNVCNVWMLKNL